MPDNKRAYDLLLAKSCELGWPHLWLADLTEHDRATLLASDAPQTFCWSVRASGTWLYSGKSGELWQLLYWEVRLMPGSHFFAYEAGHLSELSLSQAVALVERLEATQNHGKVDAGIDAEAPISTLLAQAMSTTRHPELREPDQAHAE